MFVYGHGMWKAVTGCEMYLGLLLWGFAKAAAYTPVSGPFPTAVSAAVHMCIIA